MLWLKQNHADLGGKSKLVTFKVPGLLGFWFLGDRFGMDNPVISAMHVFVGCCWAVRRA